MVETERETRGKTSKSKGVKLRTEEEEETAQESTQNEGQVAKQISIEVECNKYAYQSGAEKAEVDQKVAGTAEVNEINREDKSTEPKSPEKAVSAKKKRKKNAAKLVAGAENAGSFGPETVEVDKFAAEKKSALFVADKPKNEEVVADKPRNEKFVEGEQKKGQAAKQISIEVECNKYTDQSGAEKAEVDQKVAGSAEANETNREDKSTEPKIPDKMVSAKKNRKRNATKVVAGVESAGSLAAETVDVDRFAGEQKSALIVADKPRNEEYEEGEQKKEVIVNSNLIVGKSEQKCVPKAKLEMESPQTVKKILEVAKVDESSAKKMELQQNESEEIEVTVKTETKQKLSEKMEIDEMVEKKIENEQSEGKRKKSKKRKRANKVKGGQPQTAKKILEVAKANESTPKKVELQQNESEKEIEVAVKTETKQKLSEKMDIDEMVERKIENEQSEGKRKNSKKRKRVNKVKGGEVKKITEEEREGQKITPEVKKKTIVEEGHTKKIAEEEGEVKNITQGEGQLKTTKVDRTVEKKLENYQSKSEKGNGVYMEKEGQMKKTRQEEITTKERQKKSDATEDIEMLVNSLTEDELKEVLKSTAQKEPGLLARINRVASRDILKRTLYVKNLKLDTKSKTLRKAFLKYGKIDKAMVVADKESGKPMGFGFVEFSTKSSALSALRDPIKEISGQQCHCSLKLPRRRSSNVSYMAVHGPRESVYPGILVPRGFIDPTSLGRGEFIHGPKEAVYPGILGPGGFVDPTLLGRGEYVNPTVFVPIVNSTFSGHLNSQAVLGNFQFSNHGDFPTYMNTGS